MMSDRQQHHNSGPDRLDVSKEVSTVKWDRPTPALDDWMDKASQLEQQRDRAVRALVKIADDANYTGDHYVREIAEEVLDEPWAQAVLDDQ